MEFSKKFVCEDRERSSYIRHIAAPVFRKSFEIKNENAAGELLICGLGFYDIFVNGEKITKGFLAPYISNPDHIVYYDRYDLSPYLHVGENVIGIMLGDGFLNSKTVVWDFLDNVFNSAPKLALSVELQDGMDVKTFEAPDFLCKKGPVVFNDLRSGVFYDKRLEETGWNASGFAEDASWHEPLPADRPRGRAKLCEAEPIVVTKELKPQSIRRGELAGYEPRFDVPRSLCGHEAEEKPPVREGGYIYDFGENNAGIFRLKIKGKPGQRIDIQCSEQLVDGKVDYRNINFFPDGYVQRDLYIVGSEEEEIFEPMFTYHGFRYLYVSGITEEQATEDLLTYLVMSSALEKRGAFSCSDELSNQIFTICQRSDASNFYYFPTDCPQREKNGWTGDAQTSAEHMILTMGAERSWREWLCNIRCAQTEDGMLPGVAPTGTFFFFLGNGPAWDKVIFELPYMIWKYRGETEVIRENAHAMLSYLEYISRKRDSRGIIGIGLGDYVPVDREADEYLVPVGFTDSVMVYDMCKKGAQMFTAVNLPMHRAFAEKLGEEVLHAVRKEYIDTNKMLVTGASQTGQAMGIYYDIFEPGEKQAAFAQLLRIIKRDGEKINAGFMGTRVLFHVLSDFGESELAYRMIVGPQYPSYGYLVEQGYTTMIEQFRPEERRRMVSLNHHFQCDVEQWYMKYPGGLRVENYRQISVKPVFLKEISSATVTHQLPDGTVQVAWKREGEEISLEIQCPKEVYCHVEVDDAYKLTELGNPYFEKEVGKAGEMRFTVRSRGSR